MNKEAKLAWQRENRKARGYDRKYEKTPNGFLMRLYRNMKSRITGVQRDKAYLYEGKDLLSKEEFYSWAKEQQVFWELFASYQDSGWDRKLAPSVDRIDSTKGYIPNNMEFVTMLENSLRGTRSRWNKDSQCAIS